MKTTKKEKKHPKINMGFFEELLKEVFERMRYRAQFIRRHENIKRIKDAIDEVDSISEPNQKEKLLEIGKELFPDNPSHIFGYFILKKLKALDGEELEIIEPFRNFQEYIAFYNLPTIEIVHNEGMKSAKTVYLNYLEAYKFLTLDKPSNVSIKNYMLKNQKLEELSDECVLDAVDKKEKTITIKIHLDRKKEEIRRDIDFLLDLINEEAQRVSVDIGTPRRPQWDVYDKYLQVYDLKKEDPQMSWSDIAIKVFPKETYKSTAHRKKPKRAELAEPQAIDKVRYYWEEAEKMINEGGWKQI